MTHLKQMAINSTFCNDHSQCYTSYAMSSEGNNLVPNHLTAETLISSPSANLRHKRRKSKNNPVYLPSNSIQLLSLTKEQSENKILSSFELASKLYKSNSDEFKLTKKMRKKSNKKSVLTLPNELVPLPQSCTVSDMNDTEYFKLSRKPKAQKTKKKRQPLQKSPNTPIYNCKYHDRELDYCSEMTIDCSSVDIVECRRYSKGSYNYKTESEDVSPSDVWAVLRNINRFQFYPSPPLSGNSNYNVMPKKRKVVKKKRNRGVYETRQTEQIGYFSNIEFNIPRDGSVTGSSQKTVKGNQSELDKISKAEKISLEHNKSLAKDKRQNLPKTNNKRIKNSKLKHIKKSSPSKDTLVRQASENMLKSEQSFNRGDGSYTESLGKSVCTTVEVKTAMDFEQKEVKSNPFTHGPVSSTGTVSYSLPTHNVAKQNVKTSQSPLPSRIPYTNIPEGRPLSYTSSKVGIGPTLGLTFSKLQDSPRAPHQATADPKPPLTQTAIRKIVAKIKFPLVILGKDQVSGTFLVEQYHYSQFRGLDEHVWPFMVDWMEKPKSLALKTAKNSKQEKETILTNVDKPTRDKKDLIGVTRRTVESKQNGVPKTKPASRFRDNILKFLYKKGSNQNIGNAVLPNRMQQHATVNPVRNKNANAGLGNCKAVDSSGSIARFRASPMNRVKPRFSTTPPPPTSPSKILISTKKREPQRIWGKAKWASDFIDNIINKIKCGIYYTSELQTKNIKATAPLQNPKGDTIDLKNESKEVSIQVSMPLITEDFTPKVTIQKKKELSVVLPGFDDAMPQLEIKSMTRNKIAVKHGVTNVLLQFDVSVPAEADRISGVTFKHSTTCIPLFVTESKTKVYKYKTRILNAVLPAELCSIIPQVMMQVFNKDAPLALTAQEEKKNRSLSTISEYTISEIPEIIKFPSLPKIKMSPQPKIIGNGRFSKTPCNSWTEKSNSKEKLYIISVKPLPYRYRNIEGILYPPSSIHQRQDYLIVHPNRPLVLNLTIAETASLILPCHKSEPNLCTDLVPYKGNEVAYGGYALQQDAPLISLKELFQTTLKGITYSISQYLPTVQTCNKNLYVNFSICYNHSVGATLCVEATHFIYEPLCNVTATISSIAIVNNEHPEKQIEYIKHAETKDSDSDRTDTRKPEPNIAITKTRKKGHRRYVKLYKKCKSTTHIVAERSSTPLSKVTNLDEFFLALGAGKLLSSVLDGSCGKKIMACISDLKSYIAGITPRQALLVMLLANKKDTSNLVRFRPLILQGIAAHRITRVSELDMEVEVIEMEKFNKIPEYLYVPSLMESPQNNDNLLEELIWIAKTTASDHQRRFDESSEKLLKRLLEKRKKLNPSYLRVMARYVGLGLLKTPVNPNSNTVVIGHTSKFRE